MQAQPLIFTYTDTSALERQVRAMQAAAMRDMLAHAVRALRVRLARPQGARSPRIA